eukprot:6818140-Pyramimonas_sp.AAC.1
MYSSPYLCRPQSLLGLRVPTRRPARAQSSFEGSGTLPGHPPPNPGGSEWSWPPPLAAAPPSPASRRMPTAGSAAAAPSDDPRQPIDTR